MKLLSLLRHPALSFWLAALAVMLVVGVWAYQSSGPVSPPTAPATVAQTAQWRTEALIIGQNPDPASRAARLASQAADYAADTSGDQQQAWRDAEAAARAVAAQPADQAALSRLASATDQLVVFLPIVPGQ